MCIGGFFFVFTRSACRICVYMYYIHIGFTVITCISAHYLRTNIRTYILMIYDLIPIFYAKRLSIMYIKCWLHTLLQFVERARARRECVCLNMTGPMWIQILNIAWDNGITYYVREFYKMANKIAAAYRVRFKSTTMRTLSVYFRLKFSTI